MWIAVFVFVSNEIFLGTVAIGKYLCTYLVLPIPIRCEDATGDPAA